MSEKSVCSNCGKNMKDQWLVCKNCHQARWKMIQPYYIWGIIFLVFAWWAVTQKIYPISTSENIITLMLPIVGVIFGLISIVMLLMAIIATLRGLTVKKAISEPMPERKIDWDQLKSNSSLKEENQIELGSDSKK